MVRIKLLLAFFALVILAGAVFGVAFYWEKVAKPNLELSQRVEESRTTKLSERETRGPDLGIRQFDDAMAFLVEGELMAAKEKLLYLMKFFPESSRYADSKRIIGDINLDLLISKRPIPNKQEHTVGSGVAHYPSSIARKYDTTLDYIMQANGKTSDIFGRGEVLTVYPLNFETEIDLEKKTITLFEDEQFFKEYQVLDTNLTPNIRPPINTSVASRVSWDYDSGKPPRWGTVAYTHATRWIQTKQIGLFIRSYTPKKEPEPAAEGEEPKTRDDDRPYGVMVSKADMEELYTILSYGSPVRLVK